MGGGGGGEADLPISNQSYHDDIHGVLARAIPPVNRRTISTSQVGLSFTKVEFHKTFHIAIQLQANKKINRRGERKYAKY